MPPRAWFTCIAPGCGRRVELTEIVYRCPDCDGLLAVTQDLDALAAQHDGPGWRREFAARRAAGRGAAASSGVWRRREWVLPDLPVDRIVSLGEGDAPLIDAPTLAAAWGCGTLAVKQCGHGLTGSFKDLGMTALVSWVAHLRAEGRRIRALACASTGDTSAALAAYGARAGLPVVVLLPADKISTAQLVQPLAHGALTLALATDFDGCMRLVRTLAEEDGFYLANSMNSLRIEGQKTVAHELAEQYDWDPPDWVVIPGGNLGNVSALYKGFAELHRVGVIDRLPRLACAQAERANPLYESFRAGWAPLVPQTARATAAGAIRIGDPVSFPKAVAALQATNGVVEQATEAELAAACAQADRAGFYTCPHTGVALAALKRLCAQGVIGPRDRVAVVATAHGLKFTEFKVAYHEGRLPDAMPLAAAAGRGSAEAPDTAANRPIRLPADLAALRAALAERGW